MPALSPPPRLVHLALLTVSLLFGANYVFTKQLLATVPAPTWVAFRIAAATAILLPLGWRLGRGPIPVRAWPLLCLAALLGVVLNQVLFTEGMARTTPAHSAVINACIPVWTLCLAVAFGQERLSLRRALAVAIALLGVATLLRADDLLTGGEGLSATQILGDLLTWGNGVSFALHLVLLRRIGRGLDPYRTTAFLFVAATLMVPVYSAPSLSTAAVTAVVTPPALWLALYAVLFSTVATYLLNTWALRHTHSSQVALYINVQPLVAALLGTALGQPAPDWRFYTALAGVSAGLWLQARTP